MTEAIAPSFPASARERLRDFIEHPRVQGVIIALILLNAALLGLETWPAAMAAAGPAIRMVDQSILAVFVIEIVLRLYVHRRAFFRDPWSLFDFTVVAIALLPATGQLSVLRALRVLRVMRLLTMVPSMRRVVGALLGAIPGLLSILLVLLVIYYVFAVIATNLFGAAYPEWFGHLGRSLYTLFQIMTLESWSMGISRPVMENFPYAWAFFIPFILVATFTMLNLFIAIIVNAMQDFTTHEQEETVASTGQMHVRLDADLHTEMSGIRDEIRELKALLVTRTNLNSIPGEPA
ncbi:MAG: ion transporter [Candidatus Dechloromonas phosphoritropha]|jgi:voltage-gated sodium channel|nr:ion transporter [Candidatus Dechloromonas phosphoritropha]